LTDLAADLELLAAELELDVSPEGEPAEPLVSLPLRVGRLRAVAAADVRAPRRGSRGVLDPPRRPRFCPLARQARGSAAPPVTGRTGADEPRRRPSLDRPYRPRRPTRSARACARPCLRQRSSPRPTPALATWRSAAPAGLL